jgi:hypothetical protein
VWNALVGNAKTAGFDNLQQALGADPREWIRDWGIALYTDDTSAGADARYQFRSWNFRSLYLNLSSLVLGKANQLYPLRAPQLVSGQPRLLSLQGGGTGYARVGVPPQGRAAIRATVSGTLQLPAPSRLKVAIVRTK